MILMSELVVKTEMADSMLNVWREVIRCFGNDVIPWPAQEKEQEVFLMKYKRKQDHYTFKK